VSDPRFVEWRQKCLDLTITVEEYREAIAALRQGRMEAAPKPKPPKAPKAPKKGKKPPTNAPMQQVDLEELINQQL